MEDRLKRCGNCSKYPFCKDMIDINYYCDEWRKRENEKVRKYEVIENAEKNK